MSKNNTLKESISIVIPMYNEEQSAENVIRSLNSKLNQISNKFEIIIVESGSVDNTKKIVQNLSMGYKNIRLISQKTKEGLGSAIRLGFDNSRGDFIFYMDGDEPFDIDELEKALPLIKDCDAVIGYKIGARESFERWFISKCYNLLINTIFGLKAKDVNFSFKLIRKRVINAISLKSKGFFIDAEILIEMKNKCFKFKEIGIKYKYREKGESTVKPSPKTIMSILKEMALYILR